MVAGHERAMTMDRLKDIAAREDVLKILRADVPDFQYVNPATQEDLAKWILEDREAKVKAEKLTEPEPPTCACGSQECEHIWR